MSDGAGAESWLKRLAKGPLEALPAALKSVPAVKYALGALAVAGCVAAALGYFKSPQLALVGTIVGFALMGLMLLFSRVAALGPQQFQRPSIIFVWFCLVMFMLWAGAMTTSVFFGWPLKLSLFKTSEAATLKNPDTKDALLDAPEIDCRLDQDGTTDDEWTTNVLNSIISLEQEQTKFLDLLEEGDCVSEDFIETATGIVNQVRAFAKCSPAPASYLRTHLEDYHELRSDLTERERLLVPLIRGKKNRCPPKLAQTYGHLHDRLMLFQGCFAQYLRELQSGKPSVGRCAVAPDHTGSAGPVSANEHPDEAPTKKIGEAVRQRASSQHKEPPVHADKVSLPSPKPAAACPGCTYMKDGACVPVSCPVRCQTAIFERGCACEAPPACPAGQERRDDCGCHDRCDGFMRDCGQFEGCMRETSGNGDSCNGREHASQSKGCWSGSTSC